MPSAHHSKAAQQSFHASSRHSALTWRRSNRAISVLIRRLPVWSNRVHYLDPCRSVTFVQNTALAAARIPLMLPSHSAQAHSKRTRGLLRDRCAPAAHLCFCGARPSRTWSAPAPRRYCHRRLLPSFLHSNPCESCKGITAPRLLEREGRSLSWSEPPPRHSLGSIPAVTACGRVCPGPNPPSQLRLYGPSSPHPIRLPMKRPIVRPPRPPALPPSESSQRPSNPFCRSTGPPCPRTQRR